MKILLDTQTFIWLVNDSDKLGHKARVVLYDASNELILSYFSVFEMTIKASIGKLEYDPSVLDDLPKMGIELLALGPKALIGYAIYDPENKDPFDNALITTAINEACCLMTSDASLLNVSVNELRTLDATQ